MRSRSLAASLGSYRDDAPSTVFVYSSIDVCFLRELNDGGEGGRQLGKAAAIDPMRQASVVAVHVPPAVCYCGRRWVNYYLFGKVSSS